jgi:ubiquinone/menaquinone biosynthesis C-methylase UbiE
MSGPKYNRGNIYRNKERAEPKYAFIKTCDVIEEIHGQPQNILDVGGATGEFASYACDRFPKANVSVLEFDPLLVEQGRTQFPGINFIVGDANDMNSIPDQSSNATTMLGVHSIFDDFRPSFSECIRVTAKGGVIVIFDIFNEYDVDALIYWRHSNNLAGEYTRGHNLFSKASVSHFLGNHERVASHSYEPFMVPIDLPQRDDPMRSWTQYTDDGSKCFQDGIMPLNIQILTLRLLG